MNDQQVAEDKRITSRTIDVAIKIGAIVLILMWCFQIIAPFILPIIWGAILGIALFPLFTKLTNLLGGRKGLASSIIALIGIAILVVPTFKFSSSAFDSIQIVSEGLKAGTLDIPEPNESVKEWPLVGEKIYDLWFHASENLETFAKKHSEQIKGVATKLFTAVAGFGVVVIQFIISLLIAAAFMTNSGSCYKGCSTIAQKLMSKNGEKAISTTIATVRSVAVGILGIALTQSILSGIGLVIADIPGAGIWVLVVLLLAIVQLPPIIILGPIAAYYFSVAETTPAVIFLVWSIVVSSSDAVLKPLFLGRGMDTPMLVILLGAIGGMIMSGIIGLFVGAVVLALGYQLMIDWLAQNSNKDAQIEDNNN